jgi:hypothetical protein
VVLVAAELLQQLLVVQATLHQHHQHKEMAVVQVLLQHSVSLVVAVVARILLAVTQVLLLHHVVMQAVGEMV